MKSPEETVNTINHLMDERDRLMAKLRRSIMIRELCPGAFKHGAVTTFVLGNIYRPEACRFVVKDARGGETIFGLLEVRRELWEGFRQHALKETRGTVPAWRDAV